MLNFNIFCTQINIKKMNKVSFQKLKLAYEKYLLVSASALRMSQCAGALKKRFYVCKNRFVAGAAETRG
jgi:hypothetical protein